MEIRTNGNLVFFLATFSRTNGNFGDFLSNEAVFHYFVAKILYAKTKMEFHLFASVLYLREYWELTGEI